MKTILLALSLALPLAPVAAMAQTSTGTGNANSSSTSGAVAVGGGGGSAQAGGGNAQVIFNTPGTTVNTSNNNSRVRQSGSLKTTPNAIAPGLGSSGIETCFGPGVSGGVSVTGFGASFGAGQFDANCNARLAARTMWAFGEKRIALRIMAQDPIVQAAMQAEGMITPDAPVGYAPRPGYAAIPGAVVAPVAIGGGCKKWAGGNVGGQCLYY
jgi:hypothetical protein